MPGQKGRGVRIASKQLWKLKAVLGPGFLQLANSFSLWANALAFAFTVV